MNVKQPWATLYARITIDGLDEQFFTLMHYNFEGKDTRLNVIKDLVVFACFTGLSYAELYRLAPHNIRKGNDGELWIAIGRQKTGEEEKLPMLPKVIELMEKFKG